IYLKLHMFPTRRSSDLNNSDQVLEAFNKLPLDEVSDSLAIEIINSKGSILYQQGDFDQALQVLESGINRINELINYDIQAKIFLDRKSTRLNSSHVSIS